MLTAMGWMITALPFVVALLLGLLLPMFGALLYRRGDAGLVFMALMVAGDAVFFGQMRINLGINVYLADLGFVLLGAVAALRWALARDMPRVPVVRLAWLVWAGLFVLALALGLLDHGTTAGVHAREYFYSLVAASYFMSFAFDGERLRALATAMVSLALLLLAVAAYRWTVYALELRELLPPSGVWSPDGALRVIPAHEALLLAQVLVLSLFFARLSGAVRLARWLAPLLLGAVIALQHRSVWIAAAIGVIAALALAPRARGSALAQIAALVVVLTLTALPLAFSERLAGFSAQVGRSAATAVAGQGTVHSRLQDWRRTLDDWSRSGPRALVVGQGFGRDTSRLLITEEGERRTIRFGAHNHYVAMLTDTGVLGLAAFAVVVLATLAGLYRLARKGDQGDQGDHVASALLVLLLMQLAYYVPYGTDPWQHLLLGCAVAFVATRSAGRAPARPSPRAQIVAWR